jgi:Big-like domain-containing protein
VRGLAPPVARLATAAVTGAAVACASMAAPPGGPEDHAPAEVVLIVPESGLFNFKRRVVEIHFNEVISDRGTGPAALGQLVLISPRDGAPRVSYRRDAIAVRPRSGWRPNTTYTVTLLPGVTDLRGNTSKESRTIVFSTGGAIAPYTLRGRVFDWMAERPAPGAWIEAIARDSVVYVTIADSTGAFTIGPLPAGGYTLKGFVDQNNNRALDRGEVWDSVLVQTSRPGVETSFELLAALRDTVPPRITGVSLMDSVMLSVDFDRPLDVRQTITPGLFTVTRADSTPVPVREAMSRREFDRRQAERRAREDTTRADTGRVARPAAAQPQRVRGSEGPPRPSVPPPAQQVVVRLASPLAPGASYRVTATGVRNLLGRAGTSTRVVQVPRPAAPDTTRRTPPP